ncbi:MAG: nucleotidyltransferase domain-containing protein [Ginsengibacter sp.]
MILSHEHIKNTVREYFKDKHVSKVYLFGSYARGEADEKSDVDLIVEIDDANKRLSLFDFLNLQIGIENSLKKRLT